MTDPTEIVSAFLASWESPDGVELGFRTYLTEQVTWENHGLVTTKGINQAVSFIANIASQFKMHSQRMEVLTMAASGNTVLIERVAHLYDARGKEVAAIRGASVFEVRNGKIEAWRDYYDTLPFG